MTAEIEKSWGLPHPKSYRTEVSLYDLTQEDVEQLIIHGFYQLLSLDDAPCTSQRIELDLDGSGQRIQATIRVTTES